MNREQAIEAGAHALVRWVDDGEGWGDMEPEEQDDARAAAAAVIDAATPHLVGEPIGYVVVNRAANGFTWLGASAAVFESGQVPYERARRFNQTVCALVPVEDQP